jgi:hypothetical protein
MHHSPWALLISAVALGCGGRVGSDASSDAASPEVAERDAIVWPEVCPSMDAGDSSGEPTSYDSSVDGRWGCPGEAWASVSSAFESFEARVLHVVLSECDSPGIGISITERPYGPSGLGRGVSFALPYPSPILGRHDGIMGGITLDSGYVTGTGTLEITAATDPSSSLPGGHIEGRFTLTAEGCTVASGTFSGPYCETACIQI